MAKQKGIVEKVKSFIALDDRVVVRRLDRGDKSKGGLIHIPEGAREDRRLAEVVAVGPGVWSYGVFVEPKIKPGDIVLTVLHRGTDVQYGEENLQFIKASDCLAVVEV